ncbi:MAG: PASTA domain-containing protein [Bacteroidia bacterium]
MKKIIQFFKDKPVLKHFVLATFSTLLLVWLVLMWLNSYTNHGEQIAVPNVIGLHQDELEEYLSKRDLRYEIIDEVYSTEHPKGTVLRQDPIAHTDETPSYVKSNRKLYLTIVSDQDKMVAIPDLVGRSKRLAQAQMDIVGLKPVYQPTPYEFSDVVVKQVYKGKSVKAGDKVPYGSTIIVYVGVGQDGEPIAVPNVVGYSSEEISAYLADKSIYPFYECSNCVTKEDTLMAVAYKQHPLPSVNPTQFKRPGFTLTIFLDKNATKGNNIPLDSLNYNNQIRDSIQPIE